MPSLTASKKPSPADCTMTPINGSSAIKSIGHHAPSGTLFVEWHSGHTSAHDDWDDQKHAEFLASESKGKFFHTRIKDPHTLTVRRPARFRGTEEPA